MRILFWRKRQGPPTHKDALDAIHGLERQERSLNKYDAPIGDSANDLSNAVDLSIADGML
jgi:hypothetical protein